jgi:hypothetical protein
MITDSTSFYCNGTCMTENSAASGGWENWQVAGEHMRIFVIFK